MHNSVHTLGPSVKKLILRMNQALSPPVWNWISLRPIGPWVPTFKFLCTKLTDNNIKKFNYNQNSLMPLRWISSTSRKRKPMFVDCGWPDENFVADVGVERDDDASVDVSLQDGPVHPGRTGQRPRLRVRCPLAVGLARNFHKSVGAIRPQSCFSVITLSFVAL